MESAGSPGLFDWSSVGRSCTGQPRLPSMARGTAVSLAVSLHGEVLEEPMVQAGALNPSSAPVPGVLSDKTSPFSTKSSPICTHPPN